ncbi:hypothetical protein H4R18_004713 [Coemansia javaensis]|uniref:Inositol-1-monophosphatase n=1 Tax=Coemansia javaensis TaxID=2761396 RepID=A0A9W8HBF4_9FUNG|nr:hypothetical protein H4R18_004713 [Coemansia javaensis]
MPSQSTDAAQLQEYLDTAIALARELGPAFTDGFWRTGQFASSSAYAAEDKQGNEADCVTAVDRHIERELLARLRKLYPAHRFVGEETTAEAGDDYEVTDDPTWIVDPVDGTNNFVHHFPYTGISIALAVNREPVVGVVYLPVLGELYAAARGLGARLNGDPLPLVRPPALTTPTSLAQCSLLAEHGSARSAAVIESRLGSFTRLLLARECGGAGLQGLRVVGSAASDLVLVSKGAAEMYWELGPHAWDFAAATVILLESGGAVFDGAGWWGSAIPDADRALKPFNMWNRKLLAIRHIPDLPGQPGSGRTLQRKLAAELLGFVQDIPYTPDGRH